MFSACPKYSLQTPLLMCAKLVKTRVSRGLTKEKIELKGGNVVIGLKPGSHSGVEALKRKKKENQVGSREPFNTISAPV